MGFDARHRRGSEFEFMFRPGNNFSVPKAVKTCFANNQNDPDCAASEDYFDSVISLDLKRADQMGHAHI